MVIEAIIECQYCGIMLMISHSKEIEITNNFFSHFIPIGSINAKDLKKFHFFCGNCNPNETKSELEVFDKINNRIIKLYYK